MEVSAVDLGADPDDGAAGVESVGQELENRRAPFEHVEQVLAGFELGAARIRQELQGKGLAPEVVQQTMAELQGSED